MRILSALLFLFVSEMAVGLTPFLAIGYAGGGDRLSALTGQQGYDLSTGAGIYFSAGTIVPVSNTTPHAFELQLGLGYIFTDSGNTENRVSFSRVPAEAIYYYRNTENAFRLGWGALYHFENKISGRGPNSAAATSVDPAWGWTVSAQKVFGNPGSVGPIFGVRYNSIEYHLTRFRTKADGSSLLFTLESQFH